MYSICGETLVMTLAALSVGFTPMQPVPQTMPVDYQTLSRLPAAYVILWEQSEETGSSELRVPIALVHTLLTELGSSETIDLRVPEVLLERLYGTGRASGLEHNPFHRHGLSSGDTNVAPH